MKQPSNLYLLQTQLYIKTDLMTIAICFFKLTYIDPLETYCFYFVKLQTRLQSKTISILQNFSISKSFRTIMFTIVSQQDSINTSIAFIIIEMKHTLHEMWEEHCRVANQQHVDQTKLSCEHKFNFNIIFKWKLYFW